MIPRLFVIFIHSKASFSTFIIVLMKKTNLFHELSFFQFFRNGKGDYLIGMAFLMETTIPFISTRQILLTVSLPFTYRSD